MMNWSDYSEKTEFRIMEPRPQAPLSVTPFHQSLFSNGKIGAAFYRTGTGFYLRFPGLSDFEIAADGREVLCFPTPHVRDATPEHLYLNQVLPLLCSKAGKFAFHASAVELANGAVAFAAESGRGKSTLAAYFVARGFPLLTDDALFLEPSDQAFQVVPSHPSIRLFEDSGRMLVEMEASEAPPLHFTTKTRFLAGRGFKHSLQPRPLQTIYFLGDRPASDISFERLSTAQTLIELAKNSFLLDIEDRKMISAHFGRLAELSGSLTCYRLDYPRRFDDLKRVFQAIIDHLASERLAA